MKIGVYKGDLAKVLNVFLLKRIMFLYLTSSFFSQVVDVDNVRQRVTVKLIPRIDLQALANKLVMFVT
jgi:transcription elongation factor SPT5